MGQARELTRRAPHRVGASTSPGAAGRRQSRRRVARTAPGGGLECSATAARLGALACLVAVALSLAAVPAGAAPQASAGRAAGRQPRSGVRRPARRPRVQAASGRRTG
ncbi:MAG: hypothetical protein MZW92_19075 [Comamonadaceae bacterium]|nr:hypothetical protein [Comamonadaceae bacterium]